ncbi:DUF2169 family type VI secretion system accessory protein [Variovorax sp. PBL-E5]|uniref:DUF2169 family type VI secretion system accessory protein n=1 Tax=Variovorax sp. PBL-E5 TaxID=434014 RepID=UPI0013167F04|nr:DUF2169 domain-containing protein [Variovorax sp. PBL-E5]VTU38932.1 Type III effector pipB2 [Variovorax sp. PBL-E5]
MKVIKAFPVSLVTRCFEFRGRTSLGVSALLMVAMGQARKLWTEKDLWTFWATRAEAQWPLEEGMPRVRSEYLISGSAYTHGKDRTACAVAAQVGALRKQLIVHGERYWDGNAISPAQAFASLPLGWSHAWGGPALPENPLGMGMEDHALDGHRIRLLPRIEDPRFALNSREAVGMPAGFGPLDGMWPQRAAKRGTYDQRWMTEEFPAVASDADWTTFNSAPEDQQQAEPFKGDEAYAFHNLHPTQPLLQGRLPGLRTRVFVTQRRAGEEKFREVRMRFNTLWCFPDAERAILIFQGMHEIAEDDGADVVHVLAGIEDLDAPRPAAHYLQVRDKRLDKENGALESLREDDLMPADLVVPLFDLTPIENRALVRGQRRAEAERVAARAEVASYGLDPDAGHAPAVKGPPQPEVKTLDDLIRLRAQMETQRIELNAQAEKDKAAMLADVKKVFVEQNKDFGPIEREMAGLETRGPPKPFAAALVEDFRKFVELGKAHKGDVRELEDMLADEKLIAQWHDGDKKQLQAYRAMAHYQHAADGVAGKASTALRARVSAHHAHKGSFAGWDLTGANLSGLDLQGADFQGALLESANLTGTLLAGANLCDAVLAHATLLSTQCQGARFDRANLGAARIEKCDFGGASLVGTGFQKSRLHEVRLRGAKLDGVRFDEAVMVALDFGEATSEAMLLFFRRDLRGCSFAGARFAQCSFVECELGGADFSQAHFAKCAFVSVRAERASFRGLRIASGCFAQHCVLTGTDFDGAQLPNISFRGAALAGSRFMQAQLQGADFSECDLAQADFRQADLRQARFVRAGLKQAQLSAANLQEAVFQHARLEATDYRRANLFQSDFARVRLGGGERFDDALITRMRTYPRHRPPAGATSPS